MEQENRLDAFEKMLAAVRKEYADTSAKIEKMKADGKFKTVTCQQMLARRTMYRNMLSMYRLYGLTEEEPTETV